MPELYTASKAVEKNSMKIAITGHSAGIGQALARQYELLGHEIIGLSKRHGHNIRNIPKIADQIDPCDVFINNAQAGYAQTELLFEMARRWAGTHKHIMNISTMMTQSLVSVAPSLTEYWCQKTALETACLQLQQQYPTVRFSIIRPGDIATSVDKTVPPSADVDTWAATLVKVLDIADKNNLVIPELSLGPKQH